MVEPSLLLQEAVEGHENRVLADDPGAVQFGRRATDHQTTNGVLHGRRSSDRNSATASIISSHLEVASDLVEISVVMPCLNEVESVGICVTKALQGLATSGRRERSLFVTTGPATTLWK